MPLRLQIPRAAEESVEVDLGRQPQVAPDTLEPEALTGRLDHASELGLTGAQSNGLLSTRPVLDQASTPTSAATR
eukprot:9571128-Alexandrium_andersonii.AAC.1